MQRQIKFRMWNKEIKEMYDVGLINFQQRLIFMKHYEGYTQSSFALEDVELMQYTGLHDKNGKEVYEGDAFEDEEGYNIIVWDEENARFAVDMYGFSFWLGEGGQECYGNNIEFLQREYIEAFDISRIEITKNIYENPELLERSSNGD